MKKTLGGVILAGGAVLVSVLAATPALADTVTTGGLIFGTYGQGETGYVGVNIQNPQYELETGTTTFTLNAPPHSTFTQSTVSGTPLQWDTTNGYQPVGADESWTCASSNGNTQLTCSNITLTVPQLTNSYPGTVQLKIPVAIDNTAPWATTVSNPSGFNMTASPEIGAGGLPRLTAATQPLSYQMKADPGSPAIPVEPISLAIGTLVLGAAAAAIGVFRRKRIATQ